MDRELGAIFHHACRRHLHNLVRSRASCPTTALSRTVVAAGGEVLLSLSQAHLHTCQRQGARRAVMASRESVGFAVGSSEEDERPAIATRAAGIIIKDRRDRSKEAPRNHRVEMFVWVLFTSQCSTSGATSAATFRRNKFRIDGGSGGKGDGDIDS